MMWAAAINRILEGQFLIPALAHSLWQGLLLSVVLLAILRLVPVKRPELRYGWCCVAMAGLVCCVGATMALMAFLEDIPDRSSLSGTTVQGSAAANTTTSNVDTTPSTDTSLQLPRNYAGAKGGSAYLIWAWLSGVAIMLLRMMGLQWRAASIPRGCEPVHDDTVLALTRTLAERLGVNRTIPVLTSATLSGPAVVGWLRPVILLPVASLAGVPETVLRAAIAHELAHIRRYDYLINQVQLLLEALLFFNPAVWWISRQIRMEREACCDALAARAVGGELDYAKSLATWTEWTAATPAPALAMGGERGSALDRIRRLLESGYRPSLTRSWLGATLLSLVGLAVLAALGGGSFLATFALARALTPAERLAELEALAVAYAPGPSPYNENGGVDKSVRLRVRVTTDGDWELPGDTQVRASVDLDWQGHGYSAGYSLYEDETARQPDSRSFTMNVIEGEAYLCATAQGFAPTFSGPFTFERDSVHDDLELVLARGFETMLQVVDANANPLAGVSIEGRYDVSVSSPHLQFETDEDGIATIPNCAEEPIEWSVVVDGYEPAWLTVSHRPNKTVAWALNPAEPATGVVVNEDTGAPMAGVKLWELARLGGPKSGMRLPDDDLRLLDTTGSDGRFSLNSLRKDTQYAVMVESPSGALDFLSNVRAGDTGLEVTLPEERYIRGAVQGHLDRLPVHRDSPQIHLSAHLEIDGHTAHGFSLSAPVSMEGEQGSFAFRRLWPGNYELIAPDVRLPIKLQKNIDDLVVEIPPESATVTRDVIVRFKGTGDTPPAGTVHVNYKRRPEDRALTLREPIPLTGGEIRLRMPVPNTVYPHPDGMIGYWFTGFNQFDVVAGDGPHIAEIEVLPAGSIIGRVTETDGSPARGVTILTRTVTLPPDLENGIFDIPHPKQSSSENDAIQDFMVTPIPLNGTYRIIVRRDYTSVVSRKITLNDREPVARVDLQLDPGVTVEGRALSERGETIPGARAQLMLAVDGGGRYSGMPVGANEDGAFSFPAVNPDVDGVYELHLFPPPPYQKRVFYDVPIRTGLQTFRLPEGVEVTGVVLDPDGQPAEGVQVFAHPWEDESEAILSDQTKTDRQGAFRFEALAPVPYYFRPQKSGSGWVIRPEMDEPVDIGQTRKLTLELEEYERVVDRHVDEDTRKLQALFTEE